MTSIFLGRLRGTGILVLALLLISLGVRPALAADPDTAPPAEDKKPAPTTGGDDTSDKAPAEPAPAPAPVPQLQLDDEGPSARAAKKSHGMRLTAPLATDDLNEKPFWKTWVFWAVTGVIVAGAVGAVIYSTSGTRSSLQPCPATVTLSLGCYGAGRN